ncbi:helix-turn-helix domain-containing protein [Asaia prunellae]|uniref:helix-turn-helix domain-containing protein n=1 Tax=Asaia prunellae TaxID=610245 RepID=UPI00131ED7F1|nr:helix-turn-helix transcriptional regulator [Asaia prunellae]
MMDMIVDRVGNRMSVDRKLWATSVIATDHTQFGLRLQKAQAATGYSNRELSALMGVSGSTVNKWNKGLSPVGGAHLKRYCELLGLDIGELAEEILKHYHPHLYAALNPDKVTPDMETLIEALDYMASLNGYANRL